MLFPAALKYADVRPVFQKDDKTDKENYRPIIILPNLSKVYERPMYDQMYPLFDQIFSKLQCGFRKGFNAGRCLMHVIEKWRKYLDTGDHGSAALTDLSKAFPPNGGIPLFFQSLSNIIILFDISFLAKLTFLYH